jgi:hypothetical protein
MNVFVLFFYIYINKIMFFSFSFCPADSVIVATAPLADSVIVATAPLADSVIVAPLADIMFP